MSKGSQPSHFDTLRHQRAIRDAESALHSCSTLPCLAVSYISLTSHAQLQSPCADLLHNSIITSTAYSAVQCRGAYRFAPTFYHLIIQCGDIFVHMPQLPVDIDNWWLVWVSLSYLSATTGPAGCCPCT
jgi:hypothetical protein